MQEVVTGTDEGIIRIRQLAEADTKSFDDFHLKSPGGLIPKSLPCYHTRTCSLPLLATTKPLNTSLIFSHDFNFFMLSSQRLTLG